MFRTTSLTRNFSKGSLIVRPKNFRNVEIGILDLTDRNRFEFKAYSGKRNRPDAFYLYNSAEKRNQAVERYIQSLQAAENIKAERKARRTLTVNPVAVGDIFVSSWGYDQTNVDFYQVTEVKGKSVVIRSIASKMVEGGQASGMSSNVVAVPDAFTGEAMTKRVGTWNNGESISVKVSGSNWAYPWDGRPMYSSWYA